MPERILVVDDDEEFADLLGKLLTKRGFVAEVVYGGTEALEKALETPPAVILQDYMLPDYKGMDLLKDLKAKCPGSNVIIITARGSEEVAVDLMKSGASDYLKKPFDAEKLLATIDNVLRLRSAEEGREKLVNEITQQNLELLALNAFSTALTSTMPQEEKCKSALGIIIKNMRVEFAALFLANNGRGLRLTASAGHQMEGCDVGGQEWDCGLASYVAEIKKPAVVSDFRLEKRFKVSGKVDEMEVVSALAVPLLVKGSLIGVLAIYSREAKAFRSFDMKLMGSFASQLAMAINNDTLAERLEAVQRKWQATMDAVPDWITLQDATHTVLMANRASAERAGLTVKDLIGQKCCWVFHNSKEPIHDCPVTEAVQTKKPVYRELPLGKTAEKVQVWAYPILDKDGNLESVVEYARKAQS